MAEQRWTEDGVYLVDGHTVPKGGHGTLGDTGASLWGLLRAASSQSRDEKGHTQSGDAWPGHSSFTDSLSHSSPSAEHRG